MLFIFLKCIFWSFRSNRLDTYKTETAEKKKEHMCTLSIFMELLFAVLSEVSYGCFNECTFIVLFWVCFFSYFVITGVLVAHVQDKSSPVTSLYHCLYFFHLSFISSERRSQTGGCTFDCSSIVSAQLPLPSHILIPAAVTNPHFRFAFY